ncbi:pan apple-like domain protein [Colletotrichum incanum]|uniref:Pan apple-like domain protein n=1 Tax=Colletotrichum incanum TaxID=1573173 RepID=A0A161VSC8_COLIC|nr:pan apple-like domain protein [Colletotrichum incanum]
MMNDRPPPPDEPDPIVPRELKAKRTVPSPRKAPTVRSGKGSIFGKASIPSVYWAGDDPTPVNNEEFTFYREGTPPPEGEKAAAARARGYRQSVFDHDEDSERGRRRRCCGLRIWVFWSLVGLIMLVALGVGIGVGVGVGAGVGNKADQSDGSAATIRPSSTPTPTSGVSSTITLIVPTMSSSSISSSLSTTTTVSSTTETTLLTSTTSSTMIASPTATSGPNSICPEADNTIYNVIGSDKRFLRLCGVDYTGDDGAIDMSNTQAASMGECMEICAKAAQCTGVSWGNVMINGEAELRCWLKRDLKTSRAAVANWNFAVLL